MAKNKDQTTEDTTTDTAEVAEPTLSPVEQGQKDALQNHSLDVEATTVEEDGTVDPILVGQRQAKKNIRAERKENKELSQPADKN